MTPHLLLVEDDPVSRLFLATVLESLPARVRAAGSLAETLAGEIPPDLWLVDANLPDGSGPELLAELRRHCPATPALAHTADATSSTHQRLLAAGFAAVLVKPLQAEAVLSAVRQALGQPPANAAPGHRPLWDDQIALAALKGNAGHVAGLRQLFMAELPKQQAAIDAALAAGDHAVLHQELHRLKASCGFVGAVWLQAATEAFDRTLPDMTGLDEFNRALQATLA